MASAKLNESHPRSNNRTTVSTALFVWRVLSTVADKVKSIIVEQLGVDEEEVTPDASFVDDLGADSLDTVELVMAFEEEFGIEIPDEEAEKITRVKEAVDYIESHAKKK